MSVFFVNAENGEIENESSIPGGSSTPGAQTDAQQALANFWSKVTDDIRKIDSRDFKNQALPLARIKKIMKLDDDVKMISAEAPLLFAKAAEIFIHELTLRAWIHTEDNKRRTLQRNDIAMAITKFDQFDFLIDIVPRDEIKPNKTRDESNVRTTSMNPDQVHYYFQLAQQHQAALQQSTTQSAAPSPTSSLSTIQIVQPNGTPVQTMVTNDQKDFQTAATTAAPQTVTVAAPQHQPAPTTTQTPQVIQVQPNQATTQPTPTPGNIQIVQQIVTPTGEIQQIPIQLTPSQLQMIRMQMQSNSTQPIIIQTAPIQPQPHIIQVAQQTPLYITPESNPETD